MKTNRPANASREALRLCLQWLDACLELGWDEDSMDALEGMFWKYRDKDGTWKQTAPDAKETKK